MQRFSPIERPWRAHGGGQVTGKKLCIVSVACDTATRVTLSPLRPPCCQSSSCPLPPNIALKSLCLEQMVFPGTFITAISHFTVILLVKFAFWKRLGQEGLGVSLVLVILGWWLLCYLCSDISLGATTALESIQQGTIFIMKTYWPVLPSRTALQVGKTVLMTDPQQPGLHCVQTIVPGSVLAPIPPFSWPGPTGSNFSSTFSQVRRQPRMVPVYYWKVFLVRGFKK